MATAQREDSKLQALRPKANSIQLQDRARQFDSVLFYATSRLLSVSNIKKTAFHPISNGMVERFHRELQVSLTSRTLMSLPLVLFATHSVIWTDASFSSAELVFGNALRLPGQFFDGVPILKLDAGYYASRLLSAMEDVSPVQCRHYSRQAFVSRALQGCTHVCVRHDLVQQPLASHYDGPFKFIKRCPMYFVLLMNGHPDSVAIERIKPVFLDADVITADDKPLPKNKNVHFADTSTTF
nr:uncharacterized protein LOC126531028 [Dermacentor andersoni]